MSLATGKTAFKNTVTAWLNNAAANTDPEKVGTITEFVDMLADATETWIKTATVTVPGTGLVAPGGGGPVTGSSITGALS